MNPQLLFWVPATLRLAFVFVGTAIAWYFLGPVISLGLGLLVMCAMTVLQLHYLYRLGDWPLAMLTSTL